MRAVNLAGAVAMALTFGITIAPAQSQANVGDGSNAKAMPTNTPGYNAPTGALPGRSGNTKPVSTTIPGYALGTGSAQAWDGSSLKPATATPRFKVAGEIVSRGSRSTP